MNLSIVVETLKELLRTGVIASIPVAIDGLSQGELNFRLIGVAFLIAALRALDKMLHEMGKENPNMKVNGLVGF